MILGVNGPTGSLAGTQLVNNEQSPQVYKGPGWTGFIKQLPLESLIDQGGVTSSWNWERTGALLDPEDPRNPMQVATAGLVTSTDGAMTRLIKGDLMSVPKSSRLMQILYDSYLEPFSMHRVVGHLDFYDKVPNYHHLMVESSCEYIGQTASFVGNVHIGLGTVIMEGVSIKADTNDVYIGEGCQIMENCTITADAPRNRYAYQRGIMPNPYQTIDMSEGIARIMPNCMVEPNCFIDSAHIGMFSRIGHNSKILKGAVIGSLSHILPGSVVVADSKIGDGEIWGGAPAKKLGKVSKFDYKKPYFPSVIHRDLMKEQLKMQTCDGDQLVYFQDAMGKLTALMIQYEDSLPESTRARLTRFIKGREPFAHMVARMTQRSALLFAPDERKAGNQSVFPSIKNFAEHNYDSKPSKWNGTYLNASNIFNEFRW
jgi:carbonic anhydrase/acetyltransferase-like protein (isoleucine patch superfamily)